MRAFASSALTDRETLSVLLEINDVLDTHALKDVRERINALTFVDGSASAGALARRVKHNLELPSAEAASLSRDLLGPLLAHPQFQAAALPARVSAATVARYDVGMAYGEHTDDPVMGPAGTQQYRCDVAVTLMLSDDDSYAGGELCVRTPFGEQRARPRAGAALVYPASSLHAVAPVTRGVRLVGLAWVQSLIASAEQRQLLFDMWRVRDTLATALPDAEVTGETDRVYTNLVRMWAKP